jgi:hypothetical protein
MITCVVEYVIVPAKIDAFERFAHRWIELVGSHGGMHHGYFLPAEGASDKALALFSFPSLAAYEQYRALFGTDPDCVHSRGLATAPRKRWLRCCDIVPILDRLNE